MTAAIATLNRPSGLTPAQVDLITRTICKGADPDELSLFLSVCNRTGLDPFLRQLHAVFRYDKQTGRNVMSIQVGIDGYRLLADRTGAYAGSDEPLYEEDAGDFPLKATVTVWRLVGGLRCPFTASARWNEYKAPGPMWGKMPFLMLGKVAEALALRKAFPAELSGLYTREEMDQAQDGIVVDGRTGEVLTPPRPIRAVAPPPAARPPRKRDLSTLAARLAELAAEAAANGLAVPKLPGEEDDILAFGAGLKASLAAARSVGLPAAYLALTEVGIEILEDDKPKLGEEASYYEGAADLWRRMAKDAEADKPF